jgi:dTDP-4-dehydrorhamnose 3,5-epimerase
MTKILTLDDIDPQFKADITTQDYSKQPIIEGVKIVNLKNFSGEDGNFCEILQFNKSGEVEGFEGLRIQQINRSKINPGTIKAWHLHFKQDEIWYVSPSKNLLVGLWDLRKDSPSKDISLRVVAGEGESKLIFIPRGVAHGCANNSNQLVDLYYFVSEKFDINNPDEQRVKWDSLGADFWQPKKE